MTTQSTQARPSRFSGARHGRLRRSSATRNVLRTLLTCLIVVGISGIGVAAYAVWDMSSKVKTVELSQDSIAPDGALFAGQAYEGELAIMLVGSDSRNGQAIDDGEEGELNDVNLLLHIDESQQNATIISFPRDLMVPTPACVGPNGEEGYWPAASERQLNSTLATGGLPCVVDTIEELTDIRIPYAGLITFDGVINMSNAIGGVDICLTQPIYDPKADLDLSAGDHTLVGLEALQFLRTRHGVGDGSDKSRISNQQIFMSSLMRKLQSAETLANPAKVYGLAKATTENVLLSSSLMSVPVLQSIALAVKDLNLDNITFVQYPSFTHPYEEGRLTPDWVSAEQMLDYVRSGVSFDLAGTGEGVVDASAEGQGTDVPDPSVDAPDDSGATTDPVAPDGTETPVDPPSAVQTPPVLPQNVSGQKASLVSCSQGRTVY